MKLRIMSGLAVLALCVALANESAAQTNVKPNPAVKPPSAPPSVVINLDNALPASLTLTVNQVVAFQYGTGSSTVVIQTSAKDKKGPLLTKLRNNVLNQAGAFKASRVGPGEISVRIRPVQGKSTTAKIDITVLPACGAQGQATKHTVFGNQPKNPPPPQAVSAVEIIAKDAGGKEIARTKTDQDGNFWLPLPVGTYTLTAKAGQHYELSESVTVTANQWAHVNGAFRYTGPPIPSAGGGPVRK